MRFIIISLSYLAILVPVIALAAATTKPAQSLTIHVVDAESGKALPGATVILRREGEYKDPIPADNDGKATVHPEADASYVCILCRKDGYVSTATYWEESHGKPVALPKDFAVRLPKGNHIGGKVVDESGKPVAKAKVILDYHADEDETKQPVIVPRIADETIETDADGKWSYNGFPPDAPEIGIRVDHPDFIRDGILDKAPQKQALLDRSAVITLQRGVEVPGSVTSADGKPIAGANVSTVKTTYVVNDFGQSEKTDAQGHYRLPHVRPGVTPITVTARGFAPELQSTDVKPGMPPVDFKLAPGRTLRGRVVDPQGKPIAGAGLYLRGWRRMASISWDGKSDADGRFTMPDAPPDALEFQISKEGYRYRIREMITPPADGSEVIVTLQPEIKLSGAVVDAETKKPIEKFRVIEGCSLWEGHPPFFSFQSARPFTDGKYEFKSDAHEQVVACYVRIEAEGYTPAISPAIRGGGGTFDAALHRGSDVAGILTGPDGKPIAGADVALSPPGAQLDVWDQRVQTNEVLKHKTDAAGHFSFPPQTGDIWLVVIHDAGYAFVKGDASAAPAKNDLRLTAWSRIAGRYAPGGIPLKEKNLEAICDPVREPRDTGPKLIWRLRGGLTDADGRFHFDQVPGFDGAPCLLMIGRSEIRSFDQRRWLPLQLQPGQTTEVNIAGGCTVTGRVAPASEADRIDGEGWVLVKPAAKLPAINWSTDIFAAAAQADPVYRDSINPDGTFTVPSIPPGRYEYELIMYSGDSSGSASGGFTVPAASDTFDVGAIQYRRSRALKIGDDAPPTVGRTFDDKPIRIADYAGKFIVLAIWDSCTGRSDEHIPYLNQVADTYAGNEKIALLSINLDAVSCGMTGIPRRPHTLENAAWVRGYLTMADNEVTTRIGGEKWPAILILGPDGKVLARDLAGKDLAEKLQKLMR